jgi:UPF0755 protein
MKQIVQTVVVNVLKIVLAIILIMLVYQGGVKAYQFGYAVFAEEAVDIEPGRTFEVTVVQGKSVKDVAVMLEEYGLIKSSEIYQIREWFSTEQGDMKPGVYELNTAMLPSEMITILAGDTEEEVLE